MHSKRCNLEIHPRSLIAIRIHMILMYWIGLTSSRFVESSKWTLDWWLSFMCACSNELCSLLISLFLAIESNKHIILTASRGVQPFSVSGLHQKKSCLGPPIKFTNINENWWAKKKKKKSKCTILRWAAFIAILDHMCPAGQQVGCPWHSKCFKNLWLFFLVLQGQFS